MGGASIPISQAGLIACTTQLTGSSLTAPSAGATSASFGFTVRPDGERWSGNYRELRSVDLAEISVILAWPAYPDTTVAVRNRPSAAAPDTGLRRTLVRWRA